VVGSRLSKATPAEAHRSIAGYSVANDISMRDWQQRTLQWLQGKVFTATTPLGPEMVTADEFDPARSHAVSTFVNGQSAQESTTDQLIFTSADLLSYISTFTVLSPGDIVLTGTPGGVGMGKTPPQYLSDGDVLVTSIGGIGSQRNVMKAAQ
jgi:acylpyruvate hydrolase